jgi:hypothetical protein
MFQTQKYIVSSISYGTCSVKAVCESIGPLLPIRLEAMETEILHF